MTILPDKQSVALLLYFPTTERKPTAVPLGFDAMAIVSNDLAPRVALEEAVDTIILDKLRAELSAAD